MKKTLSNITNKLLIDLIFFIPLVLFFFITFNFSLNLEGSNNFEKYWIYPLILFWLIILSALDHCFFKLIYLKNKFNLLNYRLKSKISTHNDVLALTIILIFLSLLFFNLLLILNLPFDTKWKTNLILPIVITLIFLIFSHLFLYYSVNTTKWKFRTFLFWNTQKKKKLALFILFIISITVWIFSSAWLYYFLPDFYRYPNKVFTSSSKPAAFFDNTLGWKNGLFGQLIGSLSTSWIVTMMCFTAYEYKNKHLLILSLITLNVIMLIYVIVEWKQQKLNRNLQNNEK